MKVALSGASGNIGRLLRSQLPRNGIALRSAGWKPSIVPQHDGEDVMNGDLREPTFVDRFLEGIDVLIHLAATSVERPLPELIENNLTGLHERRFRQFESCLRYALDRSDARARRAIPSRRSLWLVENVGRRNGADVLGQARNRGNLASHRQLRAASSELPASEHLAQSRRHG
jgi:hypothetical protein